MITTPLVAAPAPVQNVARAVAECDKPVALIVEDDPDTRCHIARLLETDGWSVRTASTGEKALLMAREHVPEVMLLDLGLPTMSGLDVLRTVKSWDDQHTVVVVVSAFVMLMRAPDVCLADAMVQKPFQANDLIAQVNRTARRATSCA